MPRGPPSRWPIYIIERERLVARAADLGARMLAELAPLAQRDVVKEVRGVGLMIGVELAEPRPELYERALKAGILLRRVKDRAALTPPLVIQAVKLSSLPSAGVRSAAKSRTWRASAVSSGRAAVKFLHQLSVAVA